MNQHEKNRGGRAGATDTIYMLAALGGVREQLYTAAPDQIHVVIGRLHAQTQRHWPPRPNECVNQWPAHTKARTLAPQT